MPGASHLTINGLGINTHAALLSPRRAYAARQRYCRHVEAKLQQRAALRLQGRVLAGWLEWYEAQQARQAQLRAAVRRMAFVRLYHTFSGVRSSEMAMG